ncbi:cysteine synthase family protein [Flagellimonas sp. CMM7]|nr:cysteine synthase family protein [Flagellimonas sp. CMM7]
MEKLSGKFCNIYGKLEYVNPGGSIKDRVGYQMIKDAYASNKLKKGQYVVEMTSGNMGAGLAVVCRQYGNPLITVMSKGNSPERIKILEALGAKVLLVDQIDGTPGKVTGNDIDHAASIAIQIAEEKNAFYANQFNNSSNVRAHFEMTGPEIWSDLPSIDLFVTSIGSGATFIGTSSFLKAKNPTIKCIAVEPENSAILKTGKVLNAKHIIQGTGYGRIPSFWDTNVVDGIITVTDQEVIEMKNRLSEELGLFVGYSSGANVVASLKLAKEQKDMVNIVTILPDTGYKY